ncbi:MAG: hypothetical protein JWO32_673, partial [Bacteroidetes bacterium]|nr:hypothetical protein [Bacteroidota bacterium]
MNKIIIIGLCIAGTSLCRAQTFEIDQLEQLFRPRLRMNIKYIFDSKFKDTSGVFKQAEANAVFTFPLKTTISAEVKPDFRSLKIKDLLSNSTRIKASQTLGLLRVNTKQINAGFDSLPRKNLINITTGILGVQLTRMYNILFYSVNVSLAEEDKTFTAAMPRVSALIGQLHPRGLRKNFFYGAAATYSDGLFLPAICFGGSQPLGKHFVFNYTLPVQLNLQYRNAAGTLITAGVTGDGYRTGINYQKRRVNANYLSASVYSNLRYKINQTFVLRL